MPIEKLICIDSLETKTIGIAFLSDLMFLFRIPHYYKYLEEPVINFIAELNGIEDDDLEHANTNECSL